MHRPRRGHVAAIAGAHLSDWRGARAEAESKARAP